MDVLSCGSLRFVFTIGEMDMKKGKLFRMTEVFALGLLLGGCFLLIGLPVHAAETESGESKAALIEMDDGEYAIEVDLAGGTGRTTVTSPAGLTVLDGHAYARIEWSSSHYDYMLVEGEKYFPVNEEGYSAFEIPITVFDEPMQVIADTTAMSTPHEIEYTLTFHKDSVMSRHATPQAAAKRMVLMVLAIMAVCVIVSFVSKKKRNSRK